MAVGLMLVSLLTASMSRVDTRENVQDDVLRCGPQDVAVNGSFSDQKVLLTWEDEPLCSAMQDVLIYDIHILSTHDMKEVHTDEVVVRQDQTGSTHHWNWTSPLALECASYSLRIRCRYKNLTGRWSPSEAIPGVALSDKLQVFPKDRVVEVGSNFTFCCILGPGKRFDQMSVTGYDKSDTIITKISAQVYTMTVHLHTPSPFSPYDVKCNKNYGTCVYVGYRPADHGLQCETDDLESVECRWTVGRDTHLYRKSQTVYEFLGRKYKILTVCDKSTRTCRLRQPFNVTVGERLWTLKAQNPLGMIELTETADLTERVHIQAPHHVKTSSVNARNASLEWQWTAPQYNNLSILCQIELSHNGVKDLKNYSGVGLNFAVLHSLIPNQMYTVEIQCGAKNAFWKWSNWSSITFQTMTDVPDPLDVWWMMEDNQTVITWKRPLSNHSHGQILDYEVTWGKTRNEAVSSTQHHVSLNLSTSEERVFSVTARNWNGSSSPSSVTVPRIHPAVNSSRITGNHGCFDLSWCAHPEAICGYVVDWRPAFDRGSLEWVKVPPGVTSARISSENFQDGRRYSLSIHACTQGAPVLLEKREGYVRETRIPVKQIGMLNYEPTGSDVRVSWAPIPARNQSAFIQGYILYYTNDARQKDPNNQVFNVSTGNPEASSLRAKNLQIGSYTFTVKALTSVGEGGDSTLTITINPSDKLYLVVTIAVVYVFLLIFLFILGYKYWTCIKEKVYPPIPKPVLPGDWLTLGDQSLPILSEKEEVVIPSLHRILIPVHTDTQPREGPFTMAPACPAYENHPEINDTATTLNATAKGACRSEVPPHPPRSLFVNPLYILPMPSEGESMQYQPLSELELESDLRLLSYLNAATPTVGSSPSERISRDYQPQPFSEPHVTSRDDHPEPNFH